MNKKHLLPLAAVAVIAAGGYGASQVSAASNSSADSQSSIVQKLADTFHLDKAKVQAVFDAEHSSHQAQMQAKYEARLTQAVTDGKLTEAQKTAILAESKVLKAKMEAAKDGSDADRKTAMEAIRTEAEAWAKTNNIDAKWLMMGGGRGGHDGPGGPGGHMKHDRTDQ